MGIKYHQKYCSYFPLLVKALQEVDGDILELGGGSNSTFFLHWMALDQGRQIHTYENSPLFYKMIKVCEEEEHHKVDFVENWDILEIDGSWGIVFVDLAPAIKRKDWVRKLANKAQVILIHDSQGRSNKHYQYSEIYPLFKYLHVYTKVLPRTSVLSNFVDVTKWQL